MTHTPYDIVPFGELALAVVASACGMFGLRDGAYLQRAAQSERTFRKPALLRASQALFGLFMLGAPLIIVSDIAQSPGSMSTEGWWMFVPFVLMCVGFGDAVLRLSGPEELFLDLTARTCRRVSGWPLFPKERSGPWEDMWGVYVGVVKYSYIVGVNGSYVFGGRADLGRFGYRASAEAFAQKLTAQLGLPRVTPPDPLAALPAAKTRDRK